MSKENFAAGGCGAWAVSRKTPIYFVYFRKGTTYVFQIKHKQCPNLLKVAGATLQLTFKEISRTSNIQFCRRVPF